MTFLVDAALAEGWIARAADLERQLSEARAAGFSVSALLELKIMELSKAEAAIRVFGEELVNAGYPSGDRTVTLANLRAVLAEVARLKAALGRYGAHDGGCDVHRRDGVHDCDCGYSAARAERATEKPKG